MQNLPARLALPIKCVVDRNGHLIAADAAVRRLHASNSGDEGGVLAIPGLLDLALLCWRTGLRFERLVFVADKDHDIELWVEAVKRDQNVQLSIVGWQERDTSHPNSQPFKTILAQVPDQQYPQSMQVSHEVVILRASGGLLELFGNDIVAASFDEHFEVLDEQGPLADLLNSSNDMPDKLSIKHRSSGLKQLVLVDVVKSGANKLVGAHLVFLTHEADTHSLVHSKEEAIQPQSGVGLGRHFASAVRQPLGRILANAETIGSELNGPILEQYSTYAKDIASAAKHLSELVGDLEDLDAIDRPEFKVAREPVELGDIARRVAGLLALKAADHQIALVSPDAETKCLVVGEFRRVLQIVLNLVGNAIRYSPGGTEIRIIIDPDTSSILIDDEGPGIPEEDRERVFTKFERLGRTGDGGSGLGLYISRKLARAMGGDLSIDKSTAGGARFTLSLPAS